MDRTEEISSLLDLQEDEVAQQFAKESNLLGFGMMPPSPSDLVKAAREWIGRNRSQLCDSICANQIVRTACHIPPGKETRLHLAVAVSEAIGHAFTQLPGIPALAVLLVKMGIDTLCEQHWCAKS